MRSENICEHRESRSLAAQIPIVNRLGACSVKVGPGCSAACYRLASSAAVRDWLHGYLEWIACHRSAGRETAA